MPSPSPRGPTLAAAVAFVLCAACATSRAARLRTAIEGRAVVADSRTVVSAEFARWPDLALDEALARVRPELVRSTFLNERVVVFVDRQPSTFAELHALPAGWVRDVHLMTASEAQMEYGALVSQPVLSVRLLHLAGG